MDEIDEAQLRGIDLKQLERERFGVMFHVKRAEHNLRAHKYWQRRKAQEAFESLRNASTDGRSAGRGQ